MLSNPPFGTDWKAVESDVKNEHARGGRAAARACRQLGDAAMLFLLHGLEMRDIDDSGRGGKAGIVLNGSPLFNGGAGSGPSDIRGHMLRTTSSKRSSRCRTTCSTTPASRRTCGSCRTRSPRTGSARCSSSTWAPGGDRSCASRSARSGVEIDEKGRKAIVRAFAGTEGGDAETTVPVKVFDNLDFAYWTVTVERPLQLRFSEAPPRRSALWPSTGRLGRSPG